MATQNFTGNKKYSVLSSSGILGGNGTGNGGGAGGNTPGQLPMFYKSVRPLDKEKDKDLRISRPDNMLFAAKTNAVPLLVDEFPVVAASYPIVFADGPQIVPAAVVGIQPDQNLYIGKDGQWLKGAYLPAYVRRYPFILMDDPENKQFVLCLDDSSGLFSSTGEIPLFDGDKPSEFTQNAMEFCAVLRQQGESTEAFIKALKEQDLLVPNDSQIDLPDGSRLQLSGFLVIDPKKFDEMPESVFLEWRKKGWLGLVYAQLLSSHRWQSLVALSA